MTDRDTAFSILTRVAAELVRQSDLPDPDCDNGSFRPIGKREVRFIRQRMHCRGREIAKAIELLRKDAK